MAHPSEELSVVVRVSVLTACLALFALSFSAIVHSADRRAEAREMFGSCFDQGAVCAPRAN